MAVKVFVTRDTAGKPWPPDHTHEATGAIGLIQRLHEALDHEATLYVVLANLHRPSADLVLFTERGVGVVELKNNTGALTTRGTTWYADQRLIKAGSANVGYSNPREQVQNYANQIRGGLISRLATLWAVDIAEVQSRWKILSAVCFTNPLISIASTVKDTIEREADADFHRLGGFKLLAPRDFAAWASALRFGVEKYTGKGFSPCQLESGQIINLIQRQFNGTEWTEIRNLMPSGQPYGYLVLRQPGQQPQLFPLRRIDTTIGRSGETCELLIPQNYGRTSREHARLTRVAGNLWLEDLQSRYGIYIDGAQVDEIAAIRPGQRITLGGSAVSESVCELLFTDQLPPELQAGATADRTTI